jgi:hypothetical protein
MYELHYGRELKRKDTHYTLYSCVGVSCHVSSHLSSEDPGLYGSRLIIHRYYCISHALSYSATATHTLFFRTYSYIYDTNSKSATEVGSWQIHRSVQAWHRRGSQVGGGAPCCLRVPGPSGAAKRSTSYRAAATSNLRFHFLHRATNFVVKAEIPPLPQCRPARSPIPIDRRNPRIDRFDIQSCRQQQQHNLKP